MPPNHSHKPSHVAEQTSVGGMLNDVLAINQFLVHTLFHVDLSSFLAGTAAFFFCSARNLLGTTTLGFAVVITTLPIFWLLSRCFGAYNMPRCILTFFGRFGLTSFLLFCSTLEGSSSMFRHKLARGTGQDLIVTHLFHATNIARIITHQAIATLLARFCAHPAYKAQVTYMGVPDWSTMPVTFPACPYREGVMPPALTCKGCGHGTLSALQTRCRPPPALPRPWRCARAVR